MVNLVRRPAATAVRGAFKFDYRRPTPEQVRERASRPIGGRDSYFKSEVQFYTPRDGVNTVRILPAPPGADWGGHYGYPISVHYDIGADGSAYLCANKMLGQPCCVCDERTAASAANDEDLVKALRVGNRVGVYVIDRKDEAKGVQLWNAAEGLDKDVTKICVDASTGEVIYPEDPNAGYDLTFTREGQGLKTKYKGLVFARRESPLHDDPKQAEAWLKYVVDNPIDKMLVFHDQDYIAKVLTGQPTGGGASQPQREPAPAPAAQQQPRTEAAPSRRPLARRQPAPPPPAQAAGGEAGGDVPSWEDLAAMDENMLGDMVEEFKLDPPADGFADTEELRTWLAQSLGVEPPAPPPPAQQAAAAGAAAPAKASWRDRLNKAR